MPIVIDSNVLISALIKEGITRTIILSSNYKFLLPEYSFIEIKKHEKEILYKSGLSRQEFILLMKKLLKYVKIIRMGELIRYREKADKIMDKIDINDSLFVACALVYPNSIIWSDDKHFKMQNVIKNYNTKELVNFMSYK